jgi:cyclopropane-fatty-acyl-phospholipid synthase
MTSRVAPAGDAGLIESVRTERLEWPRLPTVSSGGLSSVRSSVARALVRRIVAKLPIRIEFPDGSGYGAGGPDGPRVLVHDERAFFARIGSGPAGLAESYLAAEWDCSDLPGLFSVFAAHLADLVPAPLQALRRIYIPGRPADEDDTIDGARRNVQRHYDLSNDFFRLFLDTSMTYSAALFEPGDSLEQAQHRKIDRLLDLTRTGPGTRLLEIGTGWGELALRAAARGALVTTVTNSTAQWELARQRAAAAGLADRIDFRRCDYREVTGSYGAIVSVEMLEAVGAKYWPVYFAAIDRLLAPGGRVGIQAITMPHDQLLASMGGQSWIHQYVFPGGQIPSTRAIREVVTRITGLEITSELALGGHYATTLARWRGRLAVAHDEVLELGFSRAFLRMWDLYLAYSQAGFIAGYLDVWHYRLERPAGH